MAGRPRAADASSRRSSTRLFHSPQSGQRPSHFELSRPQAWQAKRTRTLLMAAGSPDSRSGEVREAAEAALGLGEGLPLAVEGLVLGREVVTEGLVRGGVPPDVDGQVAAGIGLVLQEDRALVAAGLREQPGPGAPRGVQLLEGPGRPLPNPELPDDLD